MNKSHVKTLMIDILCDIVGGILYAMGIYTFAKTADFAPGGISGLALIMNYLWGLPIGTMTLILNIPLISDQLPGSRQKVSAENSAYYDYLHHYPGYPLSADPCLHRQPLYGSSLFRYLHGRGHGFLLYAGQQLRRHGFSDYDDQGKIPSLFPRNGNNGE